MDPMDADTVMSPENDAVDAVCNAEACFPCWQWLSRLGSTSSCKAKGLNLAEIMKNAGWSNSSTFSRFYDKPVDTAQAKFGSVFLN